jgi:luciferase family oxidoreductase group 1
MVVGLFPQPVQPVGFWPGQTKTNRLRPVLLKSEAMIKLSVLDQSPVSEGFTPADALRNTVELARLADRLGYERYWIAEHHAIVTLASPAPEILIARIGAETSGIRIGSGGVLLPHYSPLKVVEQFRMLHAMYPGRIDLGIGRAPGGSGLEAFALRRDRSERIQNDDFQEQLAELLAFLYHEFPSDHPFARIKVSPETPGAPEVWLLGSSSWSSSVAAQALRIGGLVIRSTKRFLKRSWSTSSSTLTSPADGGGPR